MSEVDGGCDVWGLSKLRSFFLEKECEIIKIKLGY